MSTAMPEPTTTTSTPRSGPRRLTWRSASAVGASIAAIPLSLTGAGAGGLLPVPSRPLPSALDVAAPYQGGTRCLTGERPGVVAFAKLLNATYGTHVYGIWRRCAMEHGEGRALDWMINANTPEGLELGNRITRWLAAPDAQGRPGAMARRFGVNYIIWNRQSWRAYAPERGWTPYFGVSPHTDHIHISFTWDGAYGRTSWWTGVPVTTPLTGPISGTIPVVSPPTGPMTASGYPWLKQGASGSEVTLAQRVVGTTADGAFGPKTAAAIAAWQKSKGVPVTSELDNATWLKMVSLKLIPARTTTAAPAPASSSTLTAYRGITLRLWSQGPAVTALQKALGGLAADGHFGPLTEARVKAYQSSKKLSVTGVISTSTWDRLIADATPATPKPAPSTSAKPSPLAPYAGRTLGIGATGSAVAALQKALGGLPVDGHFGPLTEARVKAYQSSKKLPATGVVAASTWAALIGTASAAPPAPAPAAPGTSTASYDTAYTKYKATTLRTGSTGESVKVLQRALGGLVVDGKFGSLTLARVKSVQTSLRLSATGVVDRAMWDALERRDHPLVAHWRTTLKRGSQGSAVAALQKALRIPADGSFGPQTEAAVKAAQKAAKLTQTGVVALLTWKAIEARMPR